MKINASSKVTLHFSLALESGDIVDSTFGKKAPSLTMGDGSLLPGFERCLLGLSAGDSAEFVVEPKDAFGAHNPLNVQQIKRDSFTEETLQVDMIVSFLDAAKHEVPGVVKVIGEEEVTVDFNHPLAGKNLIFKVEIFDVQ